MFIQNGNEQLQDFFGIAETISSFISYITHETESREALMDDNKLIRRILRARDRAAADELVERYYDETFRYAYRQSRGSGDPAQTAMDLTQEIFILVLGSLATFNPKKAGFRTWLYRVANSRIIDTKRRFHPDEVQIDETEIFEQSDFTEELHNKELLTKIEAYVSSLPSDVQRVFRLHLYGGQTFEQIAADSGLAESTVKTKYYRTVKKIKVVFSDEY